MLVLLLLLSSAVGRYAKGALPVCRYGIEMWLMPLFLEWCDYAPGRKPEEGLSRAVAWRLGRRHSWV